MLTHEENRLLTQVGPGTPGGSLLRRYWHPVAASAELTEENPKKRVTILGEELVLYRTTNGSYGLVAEQCSHRGASLYYGFLEGNCLRCPYHGWLYDQEGRCVEQPFEPQQSMLKHTIRHPAYPVQKLGGLLWTYMGPPEKQPLLPRWDILVREDGTRGVSMAPVLRCNWLQAEENTADSTHAHFLHHNYDAFLRGENPTIDLQQETPLERYGFQRFRWGITKSLFYGGDNPHVLYERPLIFPNMLRLADSIHWRVPIDDVSTQIFEVSFRASPDGQIAEQPEDPPFRRNGAWINESGEYHMNGIAAQDGMAWETQGPIFDRSKEHLGASDAGIAMFRQLLAEQIELVAEGGDPIALVTDPAENQMIDMWSHSLGIQGGKSEAGRERWAPRGVSFDELFDESHVVFEVPIGAARHAE